MLWMTLALAAERVEISVKDAADVEVVPAGEHGVVLAVKSRGDRSSYELRGYDTSFQLAWTEILEFDRPQFEVATDADDGHAWMLFQRAGEARVARARLKDGTTTTTPVTLGMKAWTNDLRSDGQGGAWVIGRKGKHGTLSWVGPDGLSAAVGLGRKRFVTGLSRGSDGHVQAAVRDWRPAPGQPFTVLDLADGQVVREYHITPDEDVFLTTGRMLDVGGQGVIAGTWEPRGLFSGAKGMYLAGFDAGGQRWFKKFAFSDLSSGFAFLNDKREARVEARIEKKKAKGKEPNIRWNLLIQDPVQTSDGFVLVAEAYYPVYQTQTRTVMVSDGRGGMVPQVQTVQVFVGWAFSHAMVMGFDADGDRLWDHSFPLRTGVSKTLRSHVRVLEEGGKVSVIYVNRGKLSIAEVSADRLTVDGRELTTADAGADEDVVKNVSGDAAWWHDDVFLLYGVDKIKEEGEKKEKVFFFTTLER